MVYLFLGQDSRTKNTQIQRIKKELLPKGLEQFNLDTLYARELNLKSLQEKILGLPVKCPKRLIVIKCAQDLKEDAREFLTQYVKKPSKRIILILDIDSSALSAKGATNQQAKLSDFLRRISRLVRVYRFKESQRIDTFTLSRQINTRNCAAALKVLDILLKNGERPERILGGLRYALERDEVRPDGIRKKIKQLLICDTEIKTGRLKPMHALEKLVIRLCSSF